jgi:hypothetical protein
MHFSLVSNISAQNQMFREKKIIGLLCILIMHQSMLIFKYMYLKKDNLKYKLF